MNYKQIALYYFKEAIAQTSSGNWCMSAEEIEDVTGRKITSRDMEAISDALDNLFGDYLLDNMTNEEGIDCMIGGAYCDYMYYPESCEEWIEANIREYGQDTIVDAEEWKDCTKAYEDCQAYIKELEEQYCDTKAIELTKNDIELIECALDFCTDRRGDDIAGGYIDHEEVRKYETQIEEMNELSARIRKENE